MRPPHARSPAHTRALARARERRPPPQLPPRGAGRTQCFLTYRLHAKFAQKFNLREFPMDRQLLFVEAVLWACPVERVLAYDEDGCAAGR